MRFPKAQSLKGYRQSTSDCVEDRWQLVILEEITSDTSGKRGLSEIGKSHEVNMSDCDTKYCQLWGIQNGLDHVDVLLIIFGQAMYLKVLGKRNQSRVNVHKVLISFY